MGRDVTPVVAGRLKGAPLPLPEKRAPLPLPLPDGSLVVVAGKGKLVGAADGRDVGLHAQANRCKHGSGLGRAYATRPVGNTLDGHGQHRAQV